jgi:hypothetical protein
MNEDMPWVNLTQEEVEELRNKKHTLTEYGKEQLRKLMNKEPLHAKVSEEDYQKVLNLMNNQEPYPDEMFEEAARREEALRVCEELFDEHGEEDTERQKLDNRCERDIDEIVLEDLTMAHYEVMEPYKSAWLGFYGADGMIHHLHIYVHEPTGELRTIWDPNTNVP